MNRLIAAVKVKTIVKPRRWKHGEAQSICGRFDSNEKTGEYLLAEANSPQLFRAHVRSGN
jgi:hypothetical protein